MLSSAWMLLCIHGSVAFQPRMSLDARFHTGREQLRPRMLINARFHAEVRRSETLRPRASVVASAPSDFSDQRPYAIAAVGDALALCLASAALSTNVLPFILSWAVFAPKLGAYADARSIGEAARAPALPLVLTIASGCEVTGLLEGQLFPPLQACLGALAASTVLVEGWRLSLFAASKADRAINAFALAVVDEDGGDEDF